MNNTEEKKAITDKLVQGLPKKKEVILSPKMMEAKNIADIGEAINNLRILVNSKYLPEALKTDLLSYISVCENDLGNLIGVSLSNGKDYPVKNIIDLDEFFVEEDEDLIDVHKDEEMLENVSIFSYDEELNKYYSKINPVLKRISELNQMGIKESSKEMQELIAKRNELYEQYDLIRERHMYDD